MLTMENKIFKDLLNKENEKKARESIYSINTTNYKFEEEVNNAIVGLNDLLNAVKQADLAIKYSNHLNNRYINNIKFNMDKIAVLLDDFIKEFKPIYENIINHYITQQLSDDNNNDSNEAAIGLYVGPNNQRGWKKKK